MHDSTDRKNNHTDDFIAKKSSLLKTLCGGTGEEWLLINSFLCLAEYVYVLASDCLQAAPTQAVGSKQFSTDSWVKNLKDPQKTVCQAEGTCAITTLKFPIKSPVIKHFISFLQSHLKWKS